MNKNKKLCLDLIKVEKEKGVIDVLKEHNLWDTTEGWKPYGEIENNFSIIGNQQSSPESALVEKLVNSIDAVLIKECLARGIHPASPEAPKTVKGAVKDFFHVHNGSLSNIDASQRNMLAEQIEFVATGYKTRPTFSIIDDGEGQYPEDFPNTFLSLAKSNKIKINFVQGKFNMGGSGVLQFCGKNNLQLIVSKRNRAISEESEWGFTVVRRQKPQGGQKSSMYTYLTIDGKIPSFKAKSLPVRPKAYPDAYGEDFESGTLIKLYEYNLSAGLKSNIKFDLYYRLNELLPELALPIRMKERREGYKGTTMQSTLNGLKIRLGDNSNNRLEDGFPSSFTIGDIVGELYVFKGGTEKNYVSDDNIIFMVNGQTHGTLPKRFFNKKAVGLGSLRDSILIILNCNEMAPQGRENLFMNSRDRLRDTKLKDKVESQLEDYISSHKGLKNILVQRRNEKIKRSLEDQRPFKEAIQDIIGHSKILSSLFYGQGDLANPMKALMGGHIETFEGKRFPTFFRMISPEDKKIQKDRDFRMRFITDANNDYFSRENEKGQLFAYRGRNRVDASVNLYNGYATVTLEPPKDAKIGDTFNYRIEMWDNSHPEPFESKFQVEVIKRVKTEPVEDTGREPPVDEDKEKDDESSGTSVMPTIIEVRKDQWSKFGFEKKDCLEIINNGELGFDFAINMDNYYILSELVSSEDIDIIKMNYKYAVSIIGMALIRSNMEDKSKEISKVLAPVIIPLTELSTKTSIEQ